jgi:RHS repeat-associated protein
VNRVTVNTGLTQRLDEYFYKAVTIDNSAAPQYPGVSVLAVQNNAGPNGEDVQSETTGNLFLAKTPEAFTHDAEGNLTFDGRWEYTWDAENRLIRQETIATVPDAAKRKLEFAYDSQNRRIRKQVFNWNGTAWVSQLDLRFLYDGWNLVAELDATNTMLRNFVWGLDLSRTPQGAGGVGGLLAIREGTESHLPAFDGNGNVMTLVKASDQSVSARYEYGPFGETLVVEENVSNPFRFSTKYHDSETGLYYYGHRYYNPLTGRWLNRDLIEESGGVNLYGFVGNDSINQLDLLGNLVFVPKWVNEGAKFDGTHLWVAAWLWPHYIDKDDQGYVLESFTVKMTKHEDCQGNKVGSYTGTNGNIQTSSPFGPDYFDKFRNSKGVKPIYTVFVDTSVGVPSNLAGCQRGQLKISWRVKTVLGVDPASGLEGYNRPMDPNDVASDSSGFTGEKRHKHWLEGGEIADGRGVKDYTINVWWDWCGKNNKKEVHKLPEWETGPNRPNR